MGTTKKFETAISINDPNSPYFISTSDNPSTSIMPMQFDGENFGAWSMVLENSLQAKVKLEFLKDTLARPEDPTLAVAWDHSNSYIKGWILASIEIKFRGMLTHARTPKDMFAILKKRYARENGPKIYQLL